MNSWKGSVTAWRRVLGVPLMHGSLTSQAMTMPGIMKALVIQNTSFHGRRSARISDSEPGISPAMR